VKIAPGRPATHGDLLVAQERDRLLRTELPRVRGAAAAWRNGLGGLLTAVVGFGLITGRSDVTQLDRAWAVAVGLLLLGALSCGAVGAFLLIRAANGRLSVVSASELANRRVVDHTEALASSAALRRGVALTLCCTVLLVAAVASMWYGPAPEVPAIRVTSPTDGTHCGTVVGVDGGLLVLQTAAGEVYVDMTKASTVQPVVSCTS
jgi:hypothetical protein